ncbi:Arrestin domain-containing protein 2 [Cladochytrium tenue]|nr:Arrestin domain-containing protein 2 [Cladochytrium tenue]
MAVSSPSPRDAPLLDADQPWFSSGQPAQQQSRLETAANTIASTPVSPTVSATSPTPPAASISGISITPRSSSLTSNNAPSPTISPRPSTASAHPPLTSRRQTYAASSSSGGNPRIAQLPPRGPSRPLDSPTGASARQLDDVPSDTTQAAATSSGDAPAVAPIPAPPPQPTRLRSGRSPTVVSFTVELDDENGAAFFEPSQGIQGRSVLVLSRPAVISAVKVQVQGLVAAGLGYTFISAESAARLTQPAPFTTSQHLFLDSITLFPSEESPPPSLRLPAGRHTWPFSFRVPPVSALPPTYRGRGGAVKYETISTLERPVGSRGNSPDHPHHHTGAAVRRKVSRREIPVRAIETREMRHAFENPLAVSIEAGAGSLWWRAGKVAVTARMPRSGFTFGEQIPLTFEITNHSANGVHLSDIAIEERTLCSFPDGSFLGPNVANKVPFTFSETFPPPTRPAASLVTRLRRVALVGPNPSSAPRSRTGAPRRVRARGQEQPRPSDSSDSVSTPVPQSLREDRASSGSPAIADDVVTTSTEAVDASANVDASETNHAEAETPASIDAPRLQSSHIPPPTTPSVPSANLPLGLNASFSSSLLSVSHFLVASIRSTRRGSPSVVMEIPLVLVAIRRDNSLLRRAIQLNAVVDDDERENMRRASLDTLPLYEPPPVTESQALAVVDEDAEGDEVVAALDAQDDSDTDDEESPTAPPSQEHPPSPDAVLQPPLLADQTSAGIPTSSIPTSPTRGISSLTVGRMESSESYFSSSSRPSQRPPRRPSDRVAVDGPSVPPGHFLVPSLSRAAGRRAVPTPRNRSHSVSMGRPSRSLPRNGVPVAAAPSPDAFPAGAIRRFSWIGPSAVPLDPPDAPNVISLLPSAPAMARSVTAPVRPGVTQPSSSATRAPESGNEEGEDDEYSTESDHSDAAHDGDEGHATAEVGSVPQVIVAPAVGSVPVTEAVNVPPAPSAPVSEPQTDSSSLGTGNARDENRRSDGQSQSLPENLQPAASPPAYRSPAESPFPPLPPPHPPQSSSSTSNTIQVATSVSLPELVVTPPLFPQAPPDYTPTTEIVVLAPFAGSSGSSTHGLRRPSLARDSTDNASISSVNSVNRHGPVASFVARLRLLSRQASAPHLSSHTSFRREASNSAAADGLPARRRAFPGPSHSTSSDSIAIERSDPVEMGPLAPVAPVDEIEPSSTLATTSPAAPAPRLPRRGSFFSFRARSATTPSLPSMSQSQHAAHAQTPQSTSSEAAVTTNYPTPPDGVFPSSRSAPSLLPTTDSGSTHSSAIAPPASAPTVSFDSQAVAPHSRWPRPTLSSHQADPRRPRTSHERPFSLHSLRWKSAPSVRPPAQPEALDGSSAVASVVPDPARESVSLDSTTYAAPPRSSSSSRRSSAVLANLPVLARRASATWRPGSPLVPVPAAAVTGTDHANPVATATAAAVLPPAPRLPTPRSSRPTLAAGHREPEPPRDVTTPSATAAPAVSFGSAASISSSPVAWAAAPLPSSRPATSAAAAAATAVGTAAVSRSAAEAGSAANGVTSSHRRHRKVAAD